ncbi:formate dehydrogenase accessory sulfurtransferase FdhD [Sphingomonas sp. G-3-2-10]|uniref:formate dehydrogenase accessory sulfurtransferase FdhD n=1 Tax=Sphingomonas sp. G-3-2-10 TaxID=2728838 RepID=UPI00146A738E|nr:formate dehydrogenase accessory sulfurtransferase FdhD [Sphingomonas sp. G-3-2-10]NML05415.1 formate dehydrogenase accessory sulfurtransferase FdhD [Sphingomonas sp. G-3-2-10]
MSAVSDSHFTRIGAKGDAVPVTRALAAEVPVAIEVNGIGYAVMMATPADLEDFAYGFIASERLGEVIEAETHDTGRGVILRVTLASSDAVIERVRHRTSDSSCGLCGIENLEAAIRPLPRLPETSLAEAEAIFRALASLRDHQPLNARTGAHHAAALCAADGTIRLAREDVGRHNGFDKLIGAMARGGMVWEGGFALLSSRCSYELVEKAVLAGCPLLVTISAPTALAVERAAEAGLALAVLARDDALLWMTP